MEPEFRLGAYCSAIFLAVFGFYARLVLYSRGRIHRYYSKRPPSLQVGESPARIAAGCTRSALLLLIVTSLAVYFGLLLFFG